MFPIIFCFHLNQYGSAKKPNDKKKSKEDEQSSAGLS